MPSGKSHRSYGSIVERRAKIFLEGAIRYAWAQETGEETAYITSQVSCQFEDSKTPPQIICIGGILGQIGNLGKLACGGSTLKKLQVKQAIEDLRDFLKILKDKRGKKKQGSANWTLEIRLWQPIASEADIDTNLKRFDEEWERQRPEQAKTKPTEGSSGRESLLQLLEPAADRIDRAVAAALALPVFRTIYDRAEQDDTPRERVRTGVDRLLNLPEVEAIRPLDLFVASLLEELQGEEPLQRALRNWLKERGKSPLAELRERISQGQAVTEGCYLLFWLRQNKEIPGKYALETYFVRDREEYGRDKTALESLKVTASDLDLDHETDCARIQELLQDSIEAGLQEFGGPSEDLAIEMFLPLHKVLWEVEHWFREPADPVCDPDPDRICALHRVVLRSSERLEARKPKQEKWQEKWELLEQAMRQGVTAKELSFCGNKKDGTEWSYNELKCRPQSEELQAALGLYLTRVPQSLYQDRPNILGVLVREGIPLAWLPRQDLSGYQTWCAGALDNTANRLCDEIHALRQETCQPEHEADGDRLGRLLCLLRDDPILDPSRPEQNYPYRLRVVAAPPA